MRKFDFSKTLKNFRWERLDVQDTSGAYVDGMWQEAATFVLRYISGIVLMPAQEDLKFLPEGESSDGVISITTKEKLYWSDVTYYGQDVRQSYVLYKGYQWRVIGCNFMQGNVEDVNIYYAKRYVSEGNL